MSGGRHLIVNADDFGLSSGVNLGIIKARENGVVTSASLMVRWPAAAEAADYGREHPSFSVGLHVDLGEWTYRDGEWKPVYEVVTFEDVNGVTSEILSQLDAFRRLTNRNPTHIDSHQHVHLREPVRSILVDIACRLGVPLRHYSSEARYCGDFYGQTREGSPLPDAISPGSLLRILEAMPDGLTELACHPGEGNDLETEYRSERSQEVETLCDPRVREMITAKHIVLCSFHNVTHFLRATEPPAR
ncbi:MAG: ChbG/HpnK family deacetylase [Candidatus Hydrogenedentota bacterium]|nr:MAG: ChbG/HpnK family deacetylase [Candidatus Hydrogenedentota bacterium]